MGWIKRLWRYLSYRAILFLAGISVVLVLGVLEIMSPFWVLILFALVCISGWFFIVRPFIRTERMTNIVLDGYTISSVERADTYALSPASQRLFFKLREILSPTQLFQMNKRQAQYLALQNQINPHFLYNTLESIRSEAMLAGLDDVADMTESLATFFRYTITKVESLVSVEEELQNCRTYFSIQKYRFGERLELEVRCDPDDRQAIYRCRIPKLTMQPILENSIIHGTELKVGTGHLTISMERTENQLFIKVSDDGLGMDEEQLAKINSRLGKDNLDIANGENETVGGLALVNVDNRIRLLFGDEYGLHVFSILGAGTDVEIILPAITSDREIKNTEVLQ